MYKLGYIDEDPDQVEKYKRDLRDYFEVVGYNISKGLPLSDLIDQVYKSDIDLLMIDYLLVDKGILTYNGDEVARRYEELKPRFPIIIFTHNESQAFPNVDNPNYIYDKASVEDTKRFVDKINKTIDLYKDYIKKRKDLINQLMEKAVKEELSSLEKHSMFEAQIELNNLDKKVAEIPYQLIDEKKLENLQKTRLEVEKFLESLIEKNKEK